MPELKIKSEFQKSYIAFGKEPVKLGEKSQKELRDLAIMALQSQDPGLLAVFDGELPNVHDMIDERAAEIKKAAEANAPRKSTSNDKQTLQPPKPTEQGGTSPKP